MAAAGVPGSAIKVLVIVQLPFSATPAQFAWFAVYPSGTVVSVAVQVAPTLAPVT